MQRLGERSFDEVFAIVNRLQGDIRAGRLEQFPDIEILAVFHDGVVDAPAAQQTAVVEASQSSPSADASATSSESPESSSAGSVETDADESDAPEEQDPQRSAASVSAEPAAPPESQRTATTGQSQSTQNRDNCNDDTLSRVSTGGRVQKLSLRLRRR